MKIEQRVKKLVAELNRLPCVCTQSSCGGYTNPDKFQLPADQFTVDFCVYEESPAFLSLGIIAEAIAVTDYDNIKLEAWANGGPEALTFDKNATIGDSSGGWIRSISSIWLQSFSDFV
jgi:hypothetical protein